MYVNSGTVFVFWNPGTPTCMQVQFPPIAFDVATHFETKSKIQTKGDMVDPMLFTNISNSPSLGMSSITVTYPPDVRHSYMICFDQWHVNRSDMYVFPVEIFKKFTGDYSQCHRYQQCPVSEGPTGLALWVHIWSRSPLLKGDECNACMRNEHCFKLLSD